MSKRQIAKLPKQEGADDFEFKVETGRWRIPDRDMVASLKAYERKVGGRAFDMKEFNAWPRRRARANVIARRFGTWRRALEAAGIEGGRTNCYANEDLMRNLEMVWRKIGRAPGVSMMRKHGTMRAFAYYRRWGTLRRACELLAAHKRGELSRADLLRGGIREYRKALAPSVRWAVLERGGHKCAACGATGAEAKLEVDHIVPVAEGGSDEMSNLRVLCFKCNRGRVPRKNGKCTETHIREAADA